MKPLEINIRIFIKQPHTLCRINGTAAAKCDYCIRREIFHCLCTCLDSFNRRIRLNLREYFKMHIICTFPEIIQDCIYISEFYHTRICYDKHVLYIRHFFKILNRVILKINTFRDLKPLHISTPLCHTLLIYQIQRRYIRTYTVSAVAAAS